MEVNMGTYESLIDLTDFGTVRHDVSHAKSPVSGIILVQTRRLLPLVAAALDSADSFAQQRLRTWFETDRVRFAGDGAMGWVKDLDLIPDEAECEVIYLPPLYVTWLRAWEWPRKCRRVSASQGS
jgi:hypothetical protein